MFLSKMEGNGLNEAPKELFNNMMVKGLWLSNGLDWMDQSMCRGLRPGVKINSSSHAMCLMNDIFYFKGIVEPGDSTPKAI